MSKTGKPYRTRPGPDGDVIYENKGWMLRTLLPHTSKFGWAPYANAASACNQHQETLNEMAAAMRREIRAWANSVAMVQADRKYLDAMKFNHFGVGEIVYMTDDEIGEMLPYVATVEPRWKDLIHPHIYNNALKEANVVPDTQNKDRGPARPDMIVSTDDGAKDLANEQGASTQVIAWNAEENKRNSKDNSKTNKQRMNELKQQNPRNEDESKDEYNKRIGRMLQN
tara:strand:+ start:2373 stop:3050 length:678 start_codon:yes stop_codon:yes gene_type:complete